MKFIKINFLVLSLFAIFFSCQKEKFEESKSFVPGVGITNSKDRGNLSLVASSHSFRNESPTSIDITGSFKDKNGNLVEVDEFVIGGIQIPSQSNNYYSSHLSELSSDAHFSEIVKSLNEGEVNIEIRDSKLGDLSTSFIIQTPIKLEIPNHTYGELKKEDGLRIKWNPNSNGIIGNRTDEQIGVAVSYKPAITKFRTNQTNLPDEPISVHKIALDSDGEVYFSAEELSELPTNGIAIIYIGRGEQVTIEYNQVDNILTYVTFSTSEDLVIL